jgi:hypothetical protein
MKVAFVRFDFFDWMGYARTAVDDVVAEASPSFANEE